MQHSVAFHQRHPCQNWQYQIPNTKFSISSSSRSPDWAKLRRGYFDFRISCQSLEKEIIITPEPVMILTWNLKHETWHETWPVIKLDMRNKTTSKKKKKKMDDYIMSGNSEVIVIFPIFGQFGAIRMPDSRHIVWKTYISIEINLLFYKKMKTELKNL